MLKFGVLSNVGTINNFCAGITIPSLSSIVAFNVEARVDFPEPLAPIIIVVSNTKFKSLKNIYAVYKLFVLSGEVRISEVSSNKEFSLYIYSDGLQIKLIEFKLIL